jgi:6-phosphofructokinase 1
MSKRNYPRSYITKDGYGITKKAIEYLQPLIKGEAEISFKDGMPKVETLKLIEVNKKLRSWT